MRPISEIASELSIPDASLEPFGRWMAKIDPAQLPQPRPNSSGRLVLITGITPTGHGVGKTVTMVGLGMGLRKIGVRAISCLRQPSLGPVFGIKGGGAGGGRATVEPLAEVNLGLTGDLDAVTNAHNLLASLIDNHLHHGNSLGLDPTRIVWPRALDLEDRALRDVEIGRGSGNGPVRSASFIITPASEVTAILGLAASPGDLRERLDGILVGQTTDGRAIYARDLKAGPAMAALLRRALLPNLLQTSEGTPVLVHGGPFGNLSYGTTTQRSLKVARQLADVVLVEAGFGTDLGGEKFVDLVAPIGNIQPEAAVLVVSLPTLHAHAPGLTGAGSLAPGLENLGQHLSNLKLFGLETVVALNRFPGDVAGEIEELKAYCRGLSVPIEESSGFADGSAGCTGLAQAVLEALKRGRPARPIYRPEQTLQEKIEAIVVQVYGGEGTDYSEEALAQLSEPEWKMAKNLPVCLAKTPLSLTDDPKKFGRPRGFRVKVRRLIRAAGAGYVVVLLGDIQTMPGLPREPRSSVIGIDDFGRPSGVT